MSVRVIRFIEEARQDLLAEPFLIPPGTPD